MPAHIATESRHRDSTATAAGPESRRAYQPSEPATAMMQSRRQPFRLSAYNHTFARTCASSFGYEERIQCEERRGGGRRQGQGRLMNPSLPVTPAPGPGPPHTKSPIIMRDICFAYRRYDKGIYPARLIFGRP